MLPLQGCVLRAQPEKGLKAPTEVTPAPLHQLTLRGARTVMVPSFSVHIQPPGNGQAS